jgi:hypothetical protein
MVAGRVKCVFGGIGFASMIRGDLDKRNDLCRPIEGDDSLLALDRL